MYPFMKTNTETNTEIQSDFNLHWLEPLENALQEISKCDARQAPIQEQGYTHLALAELSSIRVGIQYLKDILDDPLDETETLLENAMNINVKEELGRLSL